MLYSIIMRQIDVFVPSTYQGKIDAAKRALQMQYEEPVAITPHIPTSELKVYSGINEQPVGRRETTRGAKNRAEGYKEKYATEIASSTASEKFLVSMESGIFFSLRKFGVYDKTVAYVEDLTTGKSATAISDGVRFPIQDVISALFIKGGFKKNTVGKSITTRLGGDKQDPHTQVDQHTSRIIFLNQAADKALEKLRR